MSMPDHFILTDGALAHVIIPGDTWLEWENRYIDLVSKHKCFRLTKNNGYSIVDPGGDYGLLSLHGKKHLIALLFPEYDKYYQYFAESMVSVDQAGSLVLKDLLASKRCREFIKRHIHDIKEDLKDRIRYTVDIECGLDVQFTFPPSSPSAMYYMYGGSLHLVKDVLDPDNTTVPCGKFSD